MRLTVIAMVFVLFTARFVAADERERGFFDAYSGGVGLFESDRPDWKFADSSHVIGGRVGVWMNDVWGLSLRTWYFKTDAKEEMTSPSDLAFLGVSVEILARWRLDDRCRVRVTRPRYGDHYAGSPTRCWRATYRGRRAQHRARRICRGWR
jgi:hypothetical protein